MKRLLLKIGTRLLMKKGHSAYSAHLLCLIFAEDLFKNKQNSIKSKLWAYKRGFLSSDIKDCGLTDENCTQYLSLYDYYRLHPVNGAFGKWIDDKLTTKYILASFEAYLPKYYYHIKSKRFIVPLLDNKSEEPANGEAILELLEQETNLALKLISGQNGAGFYKISKVDNAFYINNSPADKAEMLKLIDDLGGYIVTEYISAHHEISRIFSPSTNAVRVMVINEDGQHPYIANSLIRFGTHATGLVDSIADKGIFAIVDIENGQFGDCKRIVNEHVVQCTMHPDTQVKVEGSLPHWEHIKSKLIDISKYLSEIRYMGFDIVITEDGFKILEINSLQEMQTYQYYYPLLVNNKAASFLNELLAENKAK